MLAQLCAPVAWASLEGWAGTGKTTLVRAMVDAYDHDQQPTIAVSDQLEPQAGEPDESAPCEHAMPAAEQQRGAAVHRAWDSDAGIGELQWPWWTVGQRGDAALHTAVHRPHGVHRWALSAEQLEPWGPTAERREQPTLENGFGLELDL